MGGPTAARHRLIGIENLKAEIAEGLPISEVAQWLGADLIPAGAEYKALCLLHSEKTPSMYLNDAKGGFHCFGCKAGGDSIELIQRVLNLSFPEALEQLAQKADVDISNYQRPLTAEEKREEEIRAQCEAWLASLGTMTTGRLGKVETAKQFGAVLSLAMPQWQSRGEKDLEREELFKEQWIFPYRTPSGRLVGWKSRDPKSKTMYGTSNSFILHEPTLFGIQVVRDKLKNGVVVVEGEFDTMVCHEQGFHNVVGTGGSAFEDAHYELLHDLRVPRITLAYDGDTGGRAAARRVAMKYWQSEVPVYIAKLPMGKDPEDMLKEPGGQHFFSMELEGARHALEYVLYDEWSNRANDLGSNLDFVRWVQKEFGSKMQSHEEALVMKLLARWMELPDATVFDLVRTEQGQLSAPESEQVVLARASQDQNYFREAHKRLAANDFYLLRHQRLWGTLIRMVAEGLEFDASTVKQQAGADGVDPEYLEHIQTKGSGNVTWHEDRVRDLAVRRAARDCARTFDKRIGDVSVDSTEAIGALTLDVSSKSLRISAEQLAISHQVDEAMEVLHQRMLNPDAIHGLNVGNQFPYLMDKMQGIQKRRLVMVAAATGVGKSTMTQQWACAMALREQVPVDYVSLEMDSVEIIDKMLSHITGIDSMKITGGRLTEDEVKRVEKAALVLRKSSLRIYAPDGITPSEFQLYARESVIERRTELFFIDYAQMVAPDPGWERQSLYDQMGHLGKVCKHKIARAMDVAVVCCAQLNKEGARKERPTKEDIGDSYNLARDSDVVVIMKGFGEDDPDTIEMWVDKNRQGPNNLLVPCRYLKETQTLFEQSGAVALPDYFVK